MMKLFSVHCGFYDEELSDGIYEFHLNIPVAADSVENAKIKVRQNKNFQKKKMHIDGIEEITLVDGFRISMVSEDGLTTTVQQHAHRDL
jgi:hypothetical protein